MKPSGEALKDVSKRQPRKMDRQMLLCGIAISIIAPFVIVAAPFVEGIGAIERVILQLVLCVGLLAIGFMSGTMVVDE